jgi:hypothetical protein
MTSKARDLLGLARYNWDRNDIEVKSLLAQMQEELDTHHWSLRDIGTNKREVAELSLGIPAQRYAHLLKCYSLLWGAQDKRATTSSRRACLSALKRKLRRVNDLWFLLGIQETTITELDRELETDQKG